MRYALLTLALILTICAVAHHRNVARVCVGTSNPAMCDLALQAGDTDAEARRAGFISDRNPTGEAR